MNARKLSCELLERRTLLTTSTGANVDAFEELVQSEPDILAEASVRFRIEVTDKAGLAQRSVRAAEDFFLNVFVEDLRLDAGGVFAAYLDLAFDANRIARTGDIVFGDLYSNVNFQGGTSPGLLDEIGGVSGSLLPLGHGEFLLFRARFQAQTPGQVAFTSEPADNTPNSLVLVYGGYSALAASQIEFGSAVVDILPKLPNAARSSLSSVNYFAQSISQELSSQFTELSPLIAAINAGTQMATWELPMSVHGRYANHRGDLVDQEWPGARSDVRDLLSLTGADFNTEMRGLQLSRSVERSSLLPDRSIELPLQSAPWRTSVMRALQLDWHRDKGLTPDEPWVGWLFDSVNAPPAATYSTAWLSGRFERIAWSEHSIRDRVWQGISFTDDLVDLSDLANALEDMLIESDIAADSLAEDKLRREIVPEQTLDTLYVLGVAIEAARGNTVAFEFGARSESSFVEAGNQSDQSTSSPVEVEISEEPSDDRDEA